jgi:hypothetical protein
VLTQKTKAAVFALLCLPGCSGQEHPPFADDESQPSSGSAPSNSGGEQLIDGDESETDGNCGFVDVEIEVLRPNFYFLLDSSDSMGEKMPNSGGVSRHLAARRAIADMLRVTGYRVNFAAGVFPDPDANDGCAAGRSVFPLRAGEPALEDGSDNPALEALSFTLRKYSPRGATPVAATLVALTEELRELPTETRLFLLTDGAPNCGVESVGCETSRCIPNIESSHFEGAPRCDEDFNCCTELFPHLCLDDDGVLEALGDLRGQGVATYVIGIPGSETYADVLSSMARAAGTARSDAESEYYPVADAEELAQTLTTLGEQLSSSCEFNLGTVPLEVELVHVLIDEDDLELDADDGFRWTGEQSIEILGSACRSWRRGGASRLVVYEHCTGNAR